MKLLTTHTINSISEMQAHKTDNCIQRALNAIGDISRESRLKVSFCKYCYYLADDTVDVETKSCAACPKKVTEVLCLDCAKKHKLCQRCGADMEYKKRKAKT